MVHEWLVASGASGGRQRVGAVGNVFHRSSKTRPCSRDPSVMWRGMGEDATLVLLRTLFEKVANGRECVRAGEKDRGGLVDLNPRA